jgi:hypothetical protein
MLLLNSPISASIRNPQARIELERDEMDLNRLHIPLVPAKAGTQFFGRVLGSGFPLSRE